MNWTQRQKQAIESKSCDITVAASAGTGKTTVLSQRAVRILGAQDLCPDVSDILVLTFTDAAAGEMKQRIAQNLNDAAIKNKNPHIRKQLLMLDSADISTIHSFCKRVISQHFHRLDLDPAFRIMDEDESKLIKAEILQQTIEAGWNDFPQGMQQLLQGRAVSNPKRNFLNCISEISDFLNTVVSRQKWFDRAAILNDAVISISSDAFENQKQIILEKLKTCREQIEWSLKLDNEITACHWREQITTECLPAIVLAIEYLKKDNLKKFIEHLNCFEGFKWINKPKGLDDNIKEFVQAPARRAIGEFKNLSSLAILNPDYQRLVGSSCSVQIKVLVELVKKFDLAYQTRKQQLISVDFSDLEKFMLILLSENGDIDSGPSDIAITLAEKYKYIFIDEYQDINPVQQKIIDLLSGKAKVFVVGDVKQSIYAWRGADCGLFVERLNNAKQDNVKSRVDLNENFRSKPGILKFVNEIFARIMTESVAVIDYDENAALKPFKDSQETGSPDVELLVVDEEYQRDSDDENEDDNNDAISFDAINRRAITVAQRIKELVEKEQFKIYDKKAACLRPCRYSDIVILTRSFAQRANNYVQILRLANIPVISDSSTGYFAATEINDMLSFLQVLDNPRQDIPLAAVLRSPVFSVSDSQLLKIKSHKNEKTDFYSLLESFAENDTQIKDILNQIDKWRTLARQTSLADLIWRIYTQTGYLSFVSAMAGGAQRRANLLKLHQRAIQFENFASNANVISLSRFVNFLQKLLDSGGDWAPAEPDSSASNAVKIMSVHKSKGLEFPIVILAETNREFQANMNSRDYITDGQNTIGFKIIDQAAKTKLPSLTWQVIKEKQRKQNLAEEMRILYVALTRAKDKLIISGSVETKNCVKLVSNAAICNLQKLPSWIIENAKCELDWIFLSLAHYKKLHEYFQPIVNVEGKDSELFDIKICQMQEISRISENLIKKRPASRYENVNPLPDKTLRENIVKNLSWIYPFDEFALIKAKQTVTSIIHEQQEYAESDVKFAFENFEKNPQKTDSLVIGSATHLVIKKMDLEKEITGKTINQAIDELVSSRCITAQIAKKINTASIIKFFRSDLGKILSDSKNKVMREWPFTYAASVSRLYPEKKNFDDEKIIIQGIIDMLVQTPGKAIIIDFKTDNINSAKAMQRAGNYKTQIQWYCKAAGEILGLEKTEGWLHFLNAEESIKVY